MIGSILAALFVLGIGGAGQDMGPKSPAPLTERLRDCVDTNTDRFSGSTESVETVRKAVMFACGEQRTALRTFLIAEDRRVNGISSDRDEAAARENLVDQFMSGIDAQLSDRISYYVLKARSK